MAAVKRYVRFLPNTSVVCKQQQQKFNETKKTNKKN